MNRRFIIAVMLLALVAPSAFAQQRLDTPEQIVRAAHADGPKSVVLALFRRGAWNAPFLRGVSRADVQWLKVAVALAPGTDAGSSEDLSDALAKALLLKPELAFGAARAIWWSHGEQVCLFGIDSELPGGVADYVARLGSALAQSTSPRFAHERAACLRGLEATRQAIADERASVG